MAYTTLAKINDAYTGLSYSIASGLIKQNALLSILPFRPASHGNKEKYRLYSSSPTISRINGGEGYTPTALDPTLKELELTMLGAIHQEPASLVDQFPSKNGKTPYESYFAERMTTFLNATGQEFTNRLLYGDSSDADQDFDGILVQATSDSTVTDLGGGAGASTDIFVIRFDEESCHGLFNETLVTNNKLVEVEWTPEKGATQMISDATGKQSKVYTAEYRTSLGMKIASSGYVSAITGIDSTHKPTVANLEKALMQVSQNIDRANTVIVCSPLGYNYLAEVLGGDARRYTSGDITNLSTVVEQFNSSMIVMDNNVSDAR